MFFYFILIFCKIYFVAIPALFRYTTVQRRLMFRNHSDRVVKHPERYGFKRTRMFYLNSEEGIRIGLWHIPPQYEDDADDDGTDCDGPPNVNFNDDRMVVMYAHGSGGSRASRHRLALYKLLCERLQLHVVTFDYRGFGDSTYVWPSSEGVVTDASTVYRWILDQGVAPQRILLWGHSLGSGISIRLLSSLPDELNPCAAVLESSFTTIKEVLQYCSISKFYNYLPYFEACFMERIVTNPETNFDSISLLHRVRCPLLILHAKDDWMVSYSLGERMYETALQVQPNHVPRPLFHSFPSEHSHSKIVYNANLHDIISDFIRNNVN